MKLNDLTGKTAIVTGAAQGLSCGMAEGLMEAGAKVCIMDINPKAEETAKQFVEKGYEYGGHRRSSVPLLLQTKKRFNRKKVEQKIGIINQKYHWR